jgi:UDP-N-acetylglucosamine transferase subunit ALG13
MSTFVTVGNANQPFRRLLEAVETNIAHLPKPVFIQHGHTPCVPGDFTAKPFVGMEDFVQLVHHSQLLIMHAGAGAMIHAITAGKRPVVMPRLSAYGEVVNDHQLEFAEAMAGVGKAWLARDTHELKQAIESALVADSTAPTPTSVPPIIGRIGELLAELTLKPGQSE